MGIFDAGFNFAVGFKERERLKELEAQAKELDRTAAPEYQTNPALESAYRTAQGQYASAQNRAKYGFEEEQKNKYEGDLAKTLYSNRFNAMRQAGGGLGAYIGASQGAQGIDAAIKFASMDADMMQRKQEIADQQYQNIFNTSNALQAQTNLIQKNRIERRNLLETALGTAISDTRSRMYGAFGAGARNVQNEYTKLQNAVGKMFMNPYYRDLDTEQKAGQEEENPQFP